MRGGGGGGSGGGSNDKVPNTPVTRQGNPIPPSPSQAIQVPSGRSGSGSIVQTAKVKSPTNITDKITLDKINVSSNGDLGISKQNEWDLKVGGLYRIDETMAINGINKIAYDSNFTYSFTSTWLMHIEGFFREEDYLTLGYWTRFKPAFFSEERAAIELGKGNSLVEEYGAFVFGNDLFTDLPITGSANYEGVNTLTVYQLNGLPLFVTGTLAGKTFLSVDFEKGTIDGRLDNFYNGLLGRSFSGTLNLNNAEIKSGNSGFFNGSVTGTFNGISYEGTYGGQFYGNNESDGLPGTVAGTMNAVSENNSYVLYGAWMGDK